MRLSVLIREAVANIRTESAGWWLAVPLFVALLATTISIDLGSQAKIFRSIDKRRLEGGYGIEVVGAIDGRRCENLNRLERFTAGATRSGSPLFLASQPSTPVPVFEVTPTALSAFRVLGERSPLGVYVTPELQVELGQRSQLALKDGTFAELAGLISPPEHLLPRSRAVISVVPSVGAFSSCLVGIWPMRADDREFVVTSLDEGSADAEIKELNAQSAIRESPIQEFQSRSTDWVLYLGLFLAPIAVAATFRVRRKQMVLLRHVGCDRASLAMMAAVEFGLAFLLSSLVAAPANVLLIKGLSQAEVSYLARTWLWWHATFGATVTVSAMALTVTVRGRSVLQVLRDG